MTEPLPRAWRSWAWNIWLASGMLFLCGLALTNVTGDPSWLIKIVYGGAAVAAAVYSVSHLRMGIVVKSDVLILASLHNKQSIPWSKIDRIVDEMFEGRDFPGPVAYLKESIVTRSGATKTRVDLMPTTMYGTKSFGRSLAKGVTEGLNEHLRCYRAGLSDTEQPAPTCENP